MENGKKTGHFWTIIAWAVAAIAVVAWLLPDGRGSTDDAATVAASTLAQRGYVAMDRRDSDPGALDQALAEFERAHTLDPGHLDTRFGLAWARQVKRLPEAEWRELYAEVAQEASVLAYLSLYNLGYAEKTAGRNAEAAALIEKALGIAPDRVDGWLELARVREAMGENASAAEAYRRAAALAP